MQSQQGYSVTYSENDSGGQRHINPMLTMGSAQSMSRSTSGASEPAQFDERLVTPFEYRQYHATMGPTLNPNEQDLRKVSDSLGRVGNRVYSQSFIPNFELSGHSLSVQPHPQPQGMFFARGGDFTTDFAVSSERHDVKPELHGPLDTEYERERASQIMQNKKTLESLGLGGQVSVRPFFRDADSH